MSDTYTCLIHIGKTGGTFIKASILNSLDQPKAKAPQILPNNLVLLGHQSLKKTETLYGENHKFAFVFRDPTERFISGFYSRLRMGQPARFVPWDSKEAAAFSHFESANNLAEALSAKDDKIKTAALAAMNGIRHLRRGYAYHFGSNISHFKTQCETRLTCCIDLKNLDGCHDDFLAKLGISTPQNINPKPFQRHQKHDTSLTPLAQKNLREHWHLEYSYYDVFKNYELK